jgi:hypothetical protein
LAGAVLAAAEPLAEVPEDEPTGELEDDEQPATSATTVSALATMPTILYRLVREPGSLSRCSMLRPYR